MFAFTAGVILLLNILFQFVKTVKDSSHVQKYKIVLTYIIGQ